MPIGVKPLLIAACRVVPELANGSRPAPLGGVISVTNHTISATGFTVGCWILLPSSRSITGRSFFGALAWYLNTGKYRLAPPESDTSNPAPVPFRSPRNSLGSPFLPFGFFLFLALLGLHPLCSSISLAACSSNNTFAGKRPAGAEDSSAWKVAPD